MHIWHYLRIVKYLYVSGHEKKWINMWKNKFIIFQIPPNLICCSYFQTQNPSHLLNFCVVNILNPKVAILFPIYFLKFSHSLFPPLSFPPSKPFTTVVICLWSLLASVDLSYFFVNVIFSKTQFWMCNLTQKSPVIASWSLDKAHSSSGARRNSEKKCW